MPSTLVFNPVRGKSKGGTARRGTPLCPAQASCAEFTAQRRLVPGLDCPEVPSYKGRLASRVALSLWLFCSECSLTEYVIGHAGGKGQRWGFSPSVSLLWQLFVSLSLLFNQRLLLFGNMECKCYEQNQHTMTTFSSLWWSSSHCLGK